MMDYTKIGSDGYPAQTTDAVAQLAVAISTITGVTTPEGTAQAVLAVIGDLADCDEEIADLGERVDENAADQIRALSVIRTGLDNLTKFAATTSGTLRLRTTERDIAIDEAARYRSALVETRRILKSSGAYIDLVYQAGLVLKAAIDQGEAH